MEDFSAACLRYAYINTGSFDNLDPIIGIPNIESSDPAEWVKVNVNPPTLQDLSNYTQEELTETKDLYIRYQIISGQDIDVYMNQIMNLRFTGPFDGERIIPVNYHRTYHRIELQTFPATTAGNNISNVIKSLDSIPMCIRPRYTSINPAGVKSNDVNIIGAVSIDSDGIITIGTDMSMSPFPAGVGQYGSLSSVTTYYI